MATERDDYAPMFTPEAWEAGWRAAVNAGLVPSHAPAARPVTRRDVETIVSAVVTHGTEEIDVGQEMADRVARDLLGGPLASLRPHLLRRIAVEAAGRGCVMLTLPRGVIEYPEVGITRIRLIVPVRKISG
jgi:hypothetical protein